MAVTNLNCVKFKIITIEYEDWNVIWTVLCSKLLWYQYEDGNENARLWFLVSSRLHYVDVFKLSHAMQIN